MGPQGTQASSNIAGTGELQEGMAGWSVVEAADASAAERPGSCRDLSWQAGSAQDARTTVRHVKA